MHLILLFGIPGSGKKTVGTALSALTDFALFDNHQVLDVVRRYIPQSNPISVKLARDFRIELIDKICQTDTPGLIMTAAAGSAGGKEFIRQLVEKVEAYDGRVSLVQLTCDYEELVRRVGLPSRQGGYKLQTQEQLDVFLKKDYFKGMDSHPAFIIDTTDTSPEESARAIYQHLFKE